MRLKQNRETCALELTRREPRRAVVCFLLLVLLTVLLSPAARAASLSANEARKLIAGVAGSSLKKGAVHVGAISAATATDAEATAEIELPFRFEQDDQTDWHVAEIRTGQDSWEDVTLLLQVVHAELEPGACAQPDLLLRKKQATDLSVKRARCLLANLLGIQLPSDAVRIKSISGFGIPLASHQSALVFARIEASFRFSRDKAGWRVTGIRTGNRAWADPQALVAEVNKEKAVRARTEIQAIAKALEAFRAQRGSYVEAKTEAVLIDFLSPAYLSNVSRLDPWRRPYRYEGTRDRFSLRSIGPDGKDNTADDVVLNGPAR
jgi:hypothetical protein